jgi:polynucleotide 5'-kinase involved in rRNA processing
MYSVPIPMSYLLNEKRVKDIIIQDGWIKGIKSIFYSTEKIRKLEANRFLYLKDEKRNKKKNTPNILKFETTLNLDGNAVHSNISGKRTTLLNRLSQQVNYTFLFFYL